MRTSRKPMAGKAKKVVILEEKLAENKEVKKKINKDRTTYKNER